MKCLVANQQIMEALNSQVVVVHMITADCESIADSGKPHCVLNLGEGMLRWER